MDIFKKQAQADLFLNSDTMYHGTDLTSYANAARMIDMNTETRCLDFAEASVLDIHDINCTTGAMYFTEINTSENPLPVAMVGKRPYRYYGTEGKFSVMDFEKAGAKAFVNEIQRNQIVFSFQSEIDPDKEDRYFMSDNAWNTFFSAKPYPVSRSTRPTSPRQISAYAFTTACELADLWNQENRLEGGSHNGIMYCVFRKCRSNPHIRVIEGFFNKRYERTPFESIATAIHELEKSYGRAEVLQWSIDHGQAAITVSFANEVAKMKKPLLNMTPCHQFITSDNGTIAPQIRTGWILPNNEQAFFTGSVKNAKDSFWEETFQKSVENHRNDVTRYFAVGTELREVPSKEALQLEFLRLMYRHNADKLGLKKFCEALALSLSGIYYREGMQVTDQYLSSRIQVGVSYMLDKMPLNDKTKKVLYERALGRMLF